MCPERRIFFLRALWRGVGRRAGVRLSVRASGGALGGPKRDRNTGCIAFGLPNVGFLMVSQFFWAWGSQTLKKTIVFP